MSSWRSFFSYNKYTQVASRAVRAGLKDTERAAADKRAEVGMKYQTWKDGKASESQWIIPPTEPQQAGTPPV